MISTPICCTSDYYSSSDIEYDDDDVFVVKAAPKYHATTKEANIILPHYKHRTSSCCSSTTKVQQSMRLLKFVKENYLSDEIFIRANFILHKFLLSISTHDVDESILITCLSVATKLSEHSKYANMTLFTTDVLMMNENLICNTLDWDIDVITPINYVEALLLHVMDYSVKDRLRQLTYELIVLCLIDVRCMDLCVVSMGTGCLLMACELINCCKIVPKQVFENAQAKDPSLERSLIYIRQVLINISRR